MDYTDLHGSPYTGPAAWNDTWVRSALVVVVAAMRGLESVKDAPEQAWPGQLAFSLRMWASERRES